MKIRHIIFIFSLVFSSITIADDGESTTATGQGTGDASSKLTEYFMYFGQYIGYDFTQQPPSILPVTLFNATAEQNLLSSLVSTFFSALPVNAIQADYKSFVPDGTADASLNSFANTTFSNYSTPSTGSSSGTVSANLLIDQQAYQNDPVSQSLLNILSTPSRTNDATCVTCIGTGCNPLCQTSVVNNVIGPLPQATDFYTTTYNASIIGQLNANSLIAPLLYSTTSNTSTTQSSGASGQSQTSTNNGLQAQNQLDLAANFIRYVISSTNPLSLPTYDDYASAYTAAMEVDSSGNPTTQALDQKAVIASYLSSLRTYAAQSSVGISNLYAMLSRRIPQSTGSETAPTSEALNEYRMATWRITPSSSTDSSKAQWIEQLNTATPAAVQKEMAILLAEINYQLYLNRQEQERLILTSTMILLQSRNAPVSTLTTSRSTAPSEASGS